MLSTSDITVSVSITIVHDQKIANLSSALLSHCLHPQQTPSLDGFLNSLLPFFDDEFTDLLFNYLSFDCYLDLIPLSQLFSSRIGTSDDHIHPSSPFGLYLRQVSVAISLLSDEELLELFTDFKNFMGHNCSTTSHVPPAKSTKVKVPSQISFLLNDTVNDVEKSLADKDSSQTALELLVEVQNGLLIYESDQKVGQKCKILIAICELILGKSNKFSNFEHFLTSTMTFEDFVFQSVLFSCGNSVCVFKLLNNFVNNSNLFQFYLNFAESVTNCPTLEAPKVEFQSNCQSNLRIDCALITNSQLFIYFETLFDKGKFDFLLAELNRSKFLIDSLNLTLSDVYCCYFRRVLLVFLNFYGHSDDVVTLLNSLFSQKPKKLNSVNSFYFSLINQINYALSSCFLNSNLSYCLQLLNEITVFNIPYFEYLVQLCKLFCEIHFNNHSSSEIDHLLPQIHELIANVSKFGFKYLQLFGVFLLLKAYACLNIIGYFEKHLNFLISYFELTEFSLFPFIFDALINNFPQLSSYSNILSRDGLSQTIQSWKSFSSN
ncbi:hypothetical protein P9112_013728 [Eukaryota sp. TZLM1-RC]